MSEVMVETCPLLTTGFYEKPRELMDTFIPVKIVKNYEDDEFLLEPIDPWEMKELCSLMMVRKQTKYPNPDFNDFDLKTEYIKTITPGKYIERINNYINRFNGFTLTRGIFIHAIFIIMYKCKVIVTYYNFYKLLIISLNVSIKYLAETYENNKFMARLGGIDLEDFNHLERKFIDLIGWNLNAGSDFTELCEGYKAYRGTDYLRDLIESTIPDFWA